MLSQTVRTSGSTHFHERDERHTSMANTIHLQPNISPRASVVHREITLKVATTFDLMGTLNCSLFVVGCSNAVSKSENFFFIFQSLFSEKRSFISASRIVKVQEFLFFICGGQRKKKSKMRIQGRLYLFYLFFSPAVIYLTFWKNEKFTSQVQLNYLKTKRQGHHPLY